MLETPVVVADSGVASDATSPAAANEPLVTPSSAPARDAEVVELSPAAAPAQAPADTPVAETAVEQPPAPAPEPVTETGRAYNDPREVRRRQREAALKAQGLLEGNE